MLQQNNNYMLNQTKKAQAAMEFLMTYGWAILIVIVAIGSLTYSGVLGGATFLPEKCTISTGSGLFCEDFAASPGIVILRLRNALPNPVTITEATITQGENSCGLTGLQSVTIPASSSTYLTLTDGLTCTLLTIPGEKLKGDISITFVKKQLPRTTQGDLLVKPASGVIDVDATNSETKGSSDYISWEHTTGNGDNRLLIVGISFDETTSVQDVTYDGISFDESIGVGEYENKVRTEIWYLVDPSEGENTIRVDLNDASDNIVAGSITFTGVNQTDPISNWGSNSGKSTNPTITVISAVGNIVVGVIGQRRVHSDEELTAGIGQTEQWQVASSNELVGEANTEVGTTTVVMEWTSPENKEWAISTASINMASE